MRVSTRSEEGATLAIVALTLFSLFGMVVLVVDVGGLLHMRRRMVTTSDAAALAAAQSCGKDQPDQAGIEADKLALANQSDATRNEFTPTDCNGSSSGSVTVAYEAPKELFFAPLLGAPTSRVVSSRATAIWGPAGGTSPVPIEFSVDDNGQIPCVYQEIGTPCAYWHDNSADHDLNNSSSWGFMNLSKWGVSPSDACPNAGTSERRDWITGAAVFPVAIETTPTYVCIDSGHSTSSWYGALQSQIGQIKHFPINDPAAMIRTNGKAKYAIIGFAALLVEDVLKGNDPEAIGVPGATGNCSGTHSFTSQEAFDLDSMGCYSTPPDGLSNLTLTRGNGGNKVTYVNGVDYSFDTSSHVVTWMTTPKTNVDIEFDWQTAGTPGKCGLHDPDPNAVCLVASWQGAQVGGSLPGAGGDFGLRAIRLSE